VQAAQPVAQQPATPVATEPLEQPKVYAPADNGWPAAEVQAVAPAHAAQVFARGRWNLARNVLHRVVDQLVEDFEYSADFMLAMRTETNAYQRLESARKRALVPVYSDRRYIVLQKLVADLNERLEDLKTEPLTNKAEILATASLKLDYARRLSEMESDALEGDSAYQDAKIRLREASIRVTDLRNAFRRSIKRNETFVAARNTMERSKIEFLASDAYFQTSVDAANAALDYAYWINRYYTGLYGGGYYPWYNYGGYGYGVGYSYGGFVGYNPYCNTAGFNRGVGANRPMRDNVAPLR
jgi:hypothetical protein